MDINIFNNICKFAKENKVQMDIDIHDETSKFAGGNSVLKDIDILDEISRFTSGNSVSKDIDILNDICKFARENKVPIIRKDTRDVLILLTRIKNPLRILEIGTAIGYSALIMAFNTGSQCNIDTIEIDGDRVFLAKQFIKKAGMDKRITVICGDAGDVISCINKKYDFIFLDGPKGQYGEYFEQLMKLLDPGGLLVCDNMHFSGMVENEKKVRRRKITIVRNLRAFTEMLKQDKRLHTIFLPVGDGVSVSCYD